MKNREQHPFTRNASISFGRGRFNYPTSGILPLAYIRYGFTFAQGAYDSTRIRVPNKKSSVLFGKSCQCIETRKDRISEEKKKVEERAAVFAK
jgi:hypothetical protein